MRERTDIEREIFNARQDLEENLARIAHRTREKLAISARVQHTIAERIRAAARWIPVLVVSVVACRLVIMLLRRARGRS